MFWGAYPQAGSNAYLSLGHWNRLKSMLELPLLASLSSERRLE